MTEGKPTQLPLLVISCDRYADLWAPFFEIFFKEWPDCPFRVLLGSNHRQFEDQRVVTIPIGDDLNWAEGVRRMLECIDSKYILIFLEDFLLRKPVDSQRVAKLVNLAVERKVGCLRLVAGLPLAFPPSRPVPGLPGIGVIDKGESYRVSAQAAIWEVAVLRQLLVPGMTAWEFEEIGTMLSSKFSQPFWAVYESAIEYSQCVEKGKWKPDGLEICRRANVPVDLSARRAFTPEELVCYFKTTEAACLPHQQMRRAVRHFVLGEWARGLTETVGLIRAAPLNPMPWGVLLVGATCPAVFSLVQQYRLKRRLQGIAQRSS